MWENEKLKDKICYAVLKVLKSNFFKGMWYNKVYPKKFENTYIAEHLLLAVSELCVLAIFINYILIKKCVSQS